MQRIMEWWQPGPLVDILRLSLARIIATLPRI